MHLINLIFLNMKDKLIQEKVLLEELNKIIKEMDAEIYFSFNEPCEQRVCLEKNKNSWKVYNVERGIKFQLKEFDSLYNACICVIKRLSYSIEQSNYFTQKYKRTLRRN